MQGLRRLFTYGSRYIDYKMAIAGALVMGITVFFINFSDSIPIGLSFTAAFKQAAYTLLFGGIIMKMCERFALEVQPKLKGLIFAVIVPSILSIGLTYLIHNLKGTPKPLASTLPTLVVIPATIVWGLMNQKKNLK